MNCHLFLVALIIRACVAPVTAELDRNIHVGWFLDSAMKPKGVSTYGKGHETEFTWSKAVPGDPHSARCKLCNRTFNIASMGRTAFLSHAQGKKHSNAVTSRETTPSAAAYTRAASAPPSGPCSSSNNTPRQLANLDQPASSSAIPALHAANASQSVPVVEAVASISSQSLIKKYLLQDAVTKAEVMWCLQAATRIHSNRAAADSASLFPVMFPDSDIAKKIQLHKDKVGYLISYGLAPFFQKQLLDILAACDYVTVGFDEALNEVSTKKQMDLAVRFWDPETDLVNTRYFSSVFLQSATSTDLRFGFKEAVGVTNERKLMQISMDGPPVNFKMLRDYQAELKEDYGTSLVDLGSCGLHVVHGAFKTGVESVDWELKEFLIGLHYLFYKSPARRGHFTKITSSDVFPIPFCFTRWVENVRVGSRAIVMMPHLETWTEEVRKEGKDNPLNKGHRNFDRVARALKDKLLGPKLAFFVSTAEMIEPFLTSFQSNNPMAPLLFRELESLSIGLLERVVKKSVLQENSRVINVDLKKSANILPAKDFDLGFSTKAAIREANNRSKPQKIPDADILKFRSDCQKLYIRIMEKLKERSPLNFKMTRAISCLDPIVAAETPSLAEDRVALALEILCTQKNLLSGAKADRIKRSYVALLRVPSVNARLKEFDGKEPRLDVLWRDLVASAPSSVPAKDDLMDFVKMLLILFHSNAALERSFSLNNDCLIVNQKETSLIGNRVVQDAVMAAGGIEKVNITKSVIQAARNAHALFLEAKKARSQKEKEVAATVAAKRKATQEIQELARKKEKIIEEAREETRKIDDRISSLTKH